MARKETNINRLFLSYARSDDEPFVRQLYVRLHREGYKLWFDRENMPSRALTFLQEIRDAVRSHDRLVVVLGPAAVKSDYVRAEWQAALVDGKVVTPILRLGGYDIVPAELANVHCLDMRETRSQDDALDELLRILKDPIPPLGVLRGVIPEVPAHFQPRPDSISALAGVMLYDIKHPRVIEGPLRTTVLHGMGGVGKSVLAAAFARSTTTRRVFGDDIFWISASSETTGLEVVQLLLSLIGSPLQPDSSLDEAVTVLREFLEERRCLIVLDNAWKLEQIDPIARSLSMVSRMIVTTRDANLAIGLGAVCQELDVLTPDEALRHLADWLGSSPEELPREAREVAKRCGFLPFALALQGAMARDGVPLSDLLHALRHAELDYAEQRFAAYPYPHVLAALQVSIDVLRVSDVAAAERFLELAVFYWDDGVPEAAIVRLWGYGDQGLPVHHVRKLLMALERKALLRLHGTAPARRIQLHDLMIDYIVACDDRVASNAKLLTVYRAASPNDWPGGPNDGYYFEHLLDHLAVAPDGGEEYRSLLVQENDAGHHAWYEAVDMAGCTSSFMRQLDHSLDGPETSAANAIRNTLLLGSIYACAANMPITLLEAFIKHGEWSPERALDYVRQIPLAGGKRGYSIDKGLRLRALLSVIPYMPQDEQGEILEEAFTVASLMEESSSGLRELASVLAKVGRIDDALAVARRLSHGDELTSGLAEVAEFVVGDKRDELIAEITGICAETLDVFRNAAIEPVLPLVDADGIAILNEQVVKPLSNEAAKSWCLVSLVQRLVDLDCCNEAAKIAVNIPDAVSKAEALTAILPHHDAVARKPVVSDILKVVLQIDDDQWRSQIKKSFNHLTGVLANIIPVIFGNLLWRPKVLGKIASYLDESQIETVMKLLWVAKDVQFKAEVTAAVAEMLPVEKREELVRHVNQFIGGTDDALLRVQAITIMAPVIAEPDRSRLLEQAIVQLGMIDSSVDRLDAFVEMMSVVESSHVNQIIDILRNFKNAEDRIQVINNLSPKLASTQLQSVRAVIDDIDDLPARLFAASALAADVQLSVQQELLIRIRELDVYPRARCLALLLPHLHADLLDNARDCIETIDDSGSLAEIALPALARCVDEPEREQLLQHAIKTAATIADAERLAWAFEAFCDQLSPEQLDLALDTFESAEKAFGNEWREYGRARYLVVALPMLQPDRRPAVHDEILSLIRQQTEADLRRDLISLLATNGDMTRFGELIDLIEQEEDPYERALSAGFVIDVAPSSMQERLVTAAYMEFDRISGTEWVTADERMGVALSRVLAYSKDPRQALTVLSKHESQPWKRPALLSFARVQASELFDQILEQAVALEDAEDRAYVLTVLASSAPAARKEEILRRALSAAMHASSDLYHERVLPDLAKALVELPAETVLDMLHEQHMRMGKLLRPELLAKLHGLAPAILHVDRELGSEIVGAILDVGRWWP